MPPSSRRKPSHPRSSQQTLAFGPRSSANKVTKPTHPGPGKRLDAEKKDTLVKALSDHEVSTPSPAPSADVPTSAEDVKAEAHEGEQQPKGLPIRAPQAQGKVRSEAEQRAAKVSEAQVKRYWKAKEDERKAPRVHQGHLPIHEKILRHFDLSSQYGPCVGLSRLKRWQRADGLGLKPPIEVLAVLMREAEKGERGGERAYVEGLLGSRYGGGE